MKLKYTLVLIPLAGLLIFTSSYSEQSSKLDFINRPIKLCLSTAANSNIMNIFSLGSSNKKEIEHPRYLKAGEVSGLPAIVANDNLKTAGIFKEGILELDLEVKWGDFRMESPDRPGLKLVAMGEVGKQATIPSPLIRVKEGTTVKAKITNTLTDSIITVYGLQKRPYTVSDSLMIFPGKTQEVSFEVGKAGAYMYRVKLGKGHSGKRFDEEDDQLAGAFVVDPIDEVSKDRIFVINVFSSKNEIKDKDPVWMESLSINGRSWPFTERIKPAVGDTLNWKIINASTRLHPMHLHGFYYKVMEKGNMNGSTTYSEDQQRKVVTETMRGRTTMSMRWVPKRPGNWLFHCHLSFHVTSEIRLPGAEEFDPDDSHQHMAGLVIGIEVQDGETDLITKGQPKEMTLFANKGSEDIVAFSFENEEPTSKFKPGPLLILKQYQTTFVHFKNRMHLPTSIHWHGLEIDSWSDGVPNWSASDGRKSPIIDPNEEFTYKLSLMRPGTFVYHSHLDDIEQLTKGLYGPMIVLGEDEVYNPDLDHFFVLGWKTPEPKGPSDFDLNGWDEIPVQNAKVGETHRLRLINIGPAGGGEISVTKDSIAIPVKMIAKDGADLPLRQRLDVKVTPKLFVGETADFSFTPNESGVYEMEFKYAMASWKQTWVVE